MSKSPRPQPAAVVEGAAEDARGGARAHLLLLREAEAEAVGEQRDEERQACGALHHRSCGRRQRNDG